MYKTLKKVIALALAAAMSMSLAACGGSSQPQQPAQPPAQDQPAEQPDTTEPAEIVVGYIAKNTVDAFHATLNSAAKESLDALVADGTISNWHLLDGLTDPVTQNNLLEDAINMGANLIIMLPAEAEGCAPMLERCRELNIPVIVVNSKTSNTDELATAYVGSNDVEAGEIMANFVADMIPDGGGYGHIQGIIGNSAQIERGMGIHNVMDGNDKWTLLEGAEQTGEWQAEKAVKFAEDWLAKYGDQLNAIICDNDDMSSAVQTAMNAAGRSDIIAVGVDGNIGPMTMVKNGELLATVYQDGAGQVKAAVDLAAQIAKGETIPKETMISFVLITQDNVDEYLK